MSQRALYLDRNLQILFGVVLMMVVGVSSIVPVLPELMLVMNAPAQQVGLVLAVFTLPGVFLTPLAGVMADRLGRKRLLVPSLYLFGLCGGACALAPDFTTLLVLRFFQGVWASPLGALHVTIIGDIYRPGQERTTAMGYAGAVLSMGTAGFPALGGFLALLGWRYPFLLPLAALPLGLWVQLGLKNPEPSTKQESLSQYFQQAWAQVRTRRAAGLFLATLLTFILLFGPYLTFLPILLQERFGVSPAVIGLLASAASLFTALSSSQLGRLTSRFGPRRLLLAAYPGYALSMLLIPLADSLWGLLPAMILFGAAHGLNLGTLMALLAELAPMKQRAAVMAVNSTILRVGQTLAPVLMGLVLLGLGLNVVFWTGTLLALVLLGLALWVIARPRPLRDEGPEPAEAGPGPERGG